MFKGQPKGLFALALANTGERFGYYTMLAIFMLFLQAKFGWEQATASQVYSIFLAAVYFMPVVRPEREIVPSEPVVLVMVSPVVGLK